MTVPRGVDVKLINVSYEIPPPRRRFRYFSTDSKPAKPILHGISAHVKPGEFLGILGPSGSGKTTLLNLIAARSEHAPQSGQVLFNNQLRSARTKRKIGYVMQDDVFFSKLTVRETLHFTAQVRSSRNFSPEDRSHRIDDLLASLRLTGCQHVQVGDQQFDKGISGGERKRLNVANELLHDPALLLADECTSGLDAASAYTVISLLRKRCVEEGRTVITTIHQPSSQIFSQFSKILVLAEGHEIYYGSPENVLNYLQALHLPCPSLHTNPADHILHLVTRQLQTELQTDQSSSLYLHSPDQQPSLSGNDDNPDYVDRLIEAWRSSEYKPLIPDSTNSFTDSGQSAPMITDMAEPYQIGTDTGEADNKGDESSCHDDVDSDTFEVIVAPSDPISPTTMVGRFRRAVEKRTLDVTCRHHIVREQGGDKYETNWFTQIKALIKRAVRQKRGIIIEKASVLNLIAIIFVTALFWFRMEPKENTVEDRLGVLSFVAVYWAFQSTFSAIFSFPKEKSVLNKDRASGAYRLSAYIAAKSIVGLIAFLPKSLSGSMFCFFFSEPYDTLRSNPYCSVPFFSLRCIG